MPEARRAVRPGARRAGAAARPARRRESASKGAGQRPAVCIGDQPSLDADPTKPGDNLGYAAFGQVVEGKEVIARILDTATDPNAGPFKGEMLAKPVQITSAARVK